MSTFDSLNDTFDITPTEPEAKPVKVEKPELSLIHISEPTRP